jgi:chromosome segregation ATPase
MSSQEYDILVPTILIGEESNSIIRDLVYRYTVGLGSGISSRDFELEITDPGNPLLLFDYKLSPHEFPSVREDQRLCFEYNRFPNNLTKLLSACREHDGYRAVIDHRVQDGPCLLLQQTTKFSLLEHLRLPLVPASDERIKGYISSEAKRFKAAYEACLQEVAQLQEELQAATSDTHGRYNALKAELARLLEQHSEELEALCAKYEGQLEKLRQSREDAILYQSRAYDEKEQHLIVKYENEIEELRQQIAALAADKTRLAARLERRSERASALAAQLADEQQRTAALESDKVELLQAQKELRADNTSVRTELAEVTAKWETTVTALEQKSELANARAAEIDELRAVVAHKDAEIAELQKTAADLAQQAKDRQWIAEKSKKVIAKHQEDIRKLVQHHNERKTEWEKRAEEAKAVEREHIKAVEEIKALQLALEHSEAKVQNLAEKNEALRIENGKLLEGKGEDRQMISYLEMQLSQVEPPEDESVASGFVPPGPFGSPTRRFPPPNKGGPRSPYVPRFHYPEPGSVFDTPPFYV